MGDLLLLAILAVVLAGVLVTLLAHVRTGVPPVSSSSAEAADIVALLRQANLPEKAVIYELGCGWGKLVAALADAFPQAEIRGVELSLFPYWIARLRTLHRANVRLRRGSFYDLDLRDADAAVCYLMPPAMPKLADFLDQSLQPGTPVVSLAFWFRGREVAARKTGPGLRGEAALYYWSA